MPYEFYLSETCIQDMINKMTANYRTNFGLEFLSDKFLLMSAHSLNMPLTQDMENVAQNSHIYCILDSPRVMIDPESLIYEIYDNYLCFSLTLIYRLNGEIIKKPLMMDIPTPIPKEVVSIEITQYPHLSVILLNSAGKIIGSTSAYEIAYQFQIKDLVEMKILYIGKSTGKKKARNALDRLKSHSTFQKILADRNAQSPDRTNFICMFTFHPTKYYTIIDGWDLTKIDGDDDFTRLMKTNKAKISEQDKTLIIEAALIRYFEPEYNKNIKYDLPGENSPTFTKCTEYDFSGVMLNLSTDNLKFKGLNYYFYTDKIKAECEHEIRIELIDPKIRKGFFSIGGESFAPKGTLRRNK